MSAPPPSHERQGREPDGLDEGDDSSGLLRTKQVLLGVSGSIAAYKAAIVARSLMKEGAVVRVALTRAAAEFVGEATFSGLTQHPVVSHMFSPSLAGELHVTLAEQSDVIVVAPATADLIARMAAGRADDLLSATLLAATCPVLLAPAMHPSMWDHPATRRNTERILADGRATFVGPVHGEVASGAVGVGRMAEPDEVVRAVIACLSPKDLDGRHVVVTAGPTIEDLDPVRFVGNRSSGKMGFALAERAAARGARVTLIAGPVLLSTPRGVDRIDVRSALALRDALWRTLGSDLSDADALVMAAAVGDYRARELRPEKMKRKEATLSIELTQNPDILGEIGHARTKKSPVLVGFAVETGTDESVIRYAQDKLRNKKVDLVVANHAAESMGKNDNRITVVSARGPEDWFVGQKWRVADRILDRVAIELGGGA